MVCLGLASQGPSTQGHVVEAVLFTVQNIPMEGYSAELLQQKTMHFASLTAALCHKNVLLWYARIGLYLNFIPTIDFI